jgi:HK97 family phage major capsid protein
MLSEIREVTNKRNRLMHSAQQLCIKQGRTAEDLSAAEKMLDEAELLTREIEIRKATDSYRQPEYLPPINDPSSDERGFSSGEQSEERRAFENYIRFGVGSERLQRAGTIGLSKEERDLLAGSGSGAYLVPQTFDPVLTEAQKAWGPILKEVRTVQTDGGQPRKMAFLNDTGSDLRESGEPASVTEQDPPLASLLGETDMLDTGIIKISIQELQDSTFNLDDLIRNVFGRRFYRGLTKKVTAGSLTGNIQSIVTGAYNAVVSDSPTAISWDNITSLYGKLDAAYDNNAVFSMNSRTRAKLLAVKDSLGRPLYIPAPTAESFDAILGKRVVLNQFLDDIGASDSPTTDTVALQLGDFREGYMLRLVKPGLAIVRLNERFMDTLEVGFIGYVRAGGVVTDAGTHPIVNLVQAN